jgi:hypothetical protein
MTVTLSQLFVSFGHGMDRHEEAPMGVGVHAIRKSRFTEAQRAYSPKQAELVISVAEV